MIITDTLPDHYGVAWAEYDEKIGYGQRDLARLFKKAKTNLKAKLEFFKNNEEKVKNGKIS
jgi:hypothetical protein